MRKLLRVFLRAGVWLNLMAAIVMSVGVSGCAHRKTHAYHAPGAESAKLPKVIAILSGPAAALLTNSPGFESEFVLSLSEDPNPSAALTGKLFVRGDKFLLAWPLSKADSTQAGGFLLMWNAAAGEGFASSEALQGYTPVAVPPAFTHLQVSKVGGAPPPLEGQMVESFDAIATDTNGQIETFELSRSKGAGALPVQLRTLKAAVDFTLTLRKIQPGAPPEDLFFPPEGFTRYGSETALLTELASRQQGYVGNRPARTRDEGDSSDSAGPRHAGPY